MRCLIAIALTLLFGLAPVAPVFAQSGQHRVMLCCRKGGAHNCAATANETSPIMRARCPMQSQPVVTAHQSAWLIGSQPVDGRGTAFLPMRVLQVEAGFRISYHRSRQKRGPPVVRLY